MFFDCLFGFFFRDSPGPVATFSSGSGAFKFQFITRHSYAGALFVKLRFNTRSFLPVTRSDSLDVPSTLLTSRSFTLTLAPPKLTPRMFDENASAVSYTVILPGTGARASGS